MRLLRALAAALTVLALAGCATTTAQRTAPPLPRTERDRDDLIDAAQQALVDHCLARQGLTLRHASDTQDRRLQGALFGRGRPELSVTLATGYTVTAHTDGCLADAQRELYGDQRLWFRTRVVVNNLRAEAQQRMKRDPDYRAATARWTRCATPAHGARPGRPDPDVSARCARDSGLTRLRARLEPSLLARVRAERHGQLTTYWQLRTRALRRAAALYAERTVQAPQKKGSTPS
ncbi:hypothetical protein OG762_03165 [Streptomyces sp. NBC_01136]|uniref:hypothetical protein n=1 Tax=unclassified Streptomyces TaxID=2593676 RepID=UPI00324382EC|nr:hypothetical protein OG762_03165 [Streptomyces sp. NBC_01136]